MEMQSSVSFGETDQKQHITGVLYFAVIFFFPESSWGVNVSGLILGNTYLHLPPLLLKGSLLCHINFKLFRLRMTMIF